MGKFNNMAVISQIEAQSEFVPTNVWLNGIPAKIVWRNSLGPVEIVDAGYEDESRTTLVIVLNNGKRFKCRAATFNGSFPFHLIDAISSVTGSGKKVELCVAIGTHRDAKASPDFFCGLRIAGSRTDAPLISL